MKSYEKVDGVFMRPRNRGALIFLRPSQLTPAAHTAWFVVISSMIF